MRATAPSAAVVRVDLPQDPQAALAFSGRPLNASLLVGDAGHEGRGELLASVGLTPGDAVFMRQVHGSRVARVGPRDRGRGIVPEVDALVTDEPDVALVVLVADCVPVLLVDPGRGVAAVHAGRRGVAAGVVGTAVEALAPVDPSRVVAVMGPAIGGCCYEVPATLADEVDAAVPGARAETTWGAPSLDLPGAVRGQLAAAGVRRVREVGECTRCRSDRWHSHRADPRSGRSAGVVCRRSSADARHVAHAGRGRAPFVD